MNTTAGVNKITIQDISDKAITLNVNGEMKEITNQLTELKELLKIRIHKPFSMPIKFII